MAKIVTLVNSKTNAIEYPRTVKSAIVNDDGTPLRFVDSNELDAVNSALSQITIQKDETKTTTFNPDGSITEVTKVGSTTTRTKTTAFPSATQIIETIVENGVTTIKTTTFNVDGTITEGVI